MGYFTLQHPILFGLGLAFIVVELFTLVNSRSIVQGLEYCRERREEGLEEGLEEAPGFLIAFGIIHTVYFIWMIWCVFVPPFTYLGLGLVGLVIPKYMYKPTGNALLWLTRTDCLATLVILIGGLMWINNS